MGEYMEPVKKYNAQGIFNGLQTQNNGRTHAQFQDGRNMMKLILSILIGVAPLALSAGDFLADFTEANTLRTKRQYAGASAAFTKLAATTQGVLKDKCLSYAAGALAAQGKYDDALALVDGISDPVWKSKTKMSVYFANRKTWQMITTEFKDENLEDWPEEIAYKGYRMRGESGGTNAAAMADLEKAIAGAGRDVRNKLLACTALAAAAKAVGDREKMIAALDGAIIASEDGSFHVNYIYLTPALARANEAIADKDYDTALKALGTMLQPKGSWTRRIQEAYGDLYAAKGDKAKAVECYKRALAEKDVREVFLKPIREKLARLEEK